MILRKLRLFAPIPINKIRMFREAQGITNKNRSGDQYFLFRQNNFLNLQLNYRNNIPGHVPNNRIINSHIVMNETIPHSSHVLPSNLIPGQLDIGRYFF